MGDSYITYHRKSAFLIVKYNTFKECLRTQRIQNPRLYYNIQSGVRFPIPPLIILLVPLQYTLDNPLFDIVIKRGINQIIPL